MVANIQSGAAQRAKPAGARRWSPRRLSNVAPSVWTLIGLLVVWELGVRAFNVQSFILPSPSEIAEDFAANWQRLLMNAWFTTFEIVLGFIVSIIVGVPLAIVITYSRFAEKAIYPLIVTSQTIPKVAIAPLMLAWFGFGLTPKIVIVVLLSFFPIVINSVLGLKASTAEMIYLAKSMGANAWQIFWKFRLPQALPNMFAGLKLATVMSVIGAIVAEFVGADSGLGFVIMEAGANFNITRQFTAIVIISVIGMIFFTLIEWLERVVIPWKAPAEGSGES